MVATCIILATQEAKIKRMEIQGQPWQKVCKTSSQQKRLGMVACIYPRYLRSVNRKIAVQASPGKKLYPISKRTIAKRSRSII
jgi:hypothetical protein